MNMVQIQKYRFVLPAVIHSAAGFLQLFTVSVLSFQTTFNTHTENISDVTVIKVTCTDLHFIPHNDLFFKQVYCIF